MKILYITPSLPNDFSRIRTKNILKAFKKEKHEVTLISFYQNKKDLGYLDETKKLVNDVILVKQPYIFSIINCLIGIFLPIPLRVAYYYNPIFKSKIKNIYKNYDLIYIKRLRMAQYGKNINNKVVIDITDSLTKYYDRLKSKPGLIQKILSYEEYIKHKYYEVKIAKNNNTIICSEEDKKYLENISNTKLNNMMVIRNTIDTSNWINQNIKVKAKGNRVKLCFLGMMDYTPNVIAAHYFIKQILPKLDAKYDVTFIGKNCSKSLLKLSSKRIKFAGYVSDLKNELIKYDIFVCPITVGSGIKNKIFQAICAGLPIVSTDLGVEGMKLVIKNKIRIANDPKSFVEQIENINSINDSILLKNLSEAQNIIVKEYDIKRSMSVLLDGVK